MASKKIKWPALVMCQDCANAVPVTHEFVAHDGRPIFCTCKYEKHYKMLRWAQPCMNYEQNN